MRKMKGQRPGSERWEHEDHHWHVEISILGRYRCTFHSTQFVCPAELQKLDDGTFRLSGTHNHNPPNEYEDKRTLTEALKERAIAEIEDPPGHVVDFVFREHPRIAYLMQRDAGRKCVSRERVRFNTKIPDTMDGLGDMLRDYPPADAIFRDHLIATDGSVVTIFASPAMLRRMNDAVELHVDGTFKAIPDRPRPAQLFIISMREMDIGIPAVYVLCSRRTIATYTKIWEFLLDAAPELRRNLRTVISDFKPAIISCVPRVMPWVTVRGCWFHFIRAVCRKWQRLDLSAAPEEVLHLTWALPLASEDRFVEGFNVIREQAQLIEVNFPTVGQFIEYLRTFWVPRASIVSVRRSPVRTNNIAEGFNRRIVELLGGEFPPLSRFIGKLCDIVNDIEIKWMRIEAGTDLDRDRRARQVNNDIHIEEHQQNLDNNRCTMLYFLQNAMVPRVLREVEQEIARPAIDDDDFPDDDDEILINRNNDRDLPVRAGL